MQPTIRMATTRDIPKIKEIASSVLAEYGLPMDPACIDADLEDVARNYFLSGGMFEVVEDASGEIVGTVGLYPVSPERVELRHMYLQPSVRGQGLGRRLMERMLARAHSSGFEEIRLETAPAFKEAIRLYQSYGFTLTGAEPRLPRCDHVYVLRLPEHARKRPAPVGVPRRFGVGLLLVVTTVYALLFGVLRALHFPAMAFVMVVGYVTVIGLGQAILFGGKKPRLASYLVGAAVCLVLYMLTFWRAILLIGSWKSFPELLSIVFWSLTVGGLSGYVTGCLVGGVFLIAKQWKGGHRA
ncbi:MAG: GNAT family N-acetyltransferase [Thermoguttaceae bacterium]